jgi:protein O-GlcNAc transferase
MAIGDGMTWEQRLREGVNSHQQGKLAEAEQCYRQVLHLVPDQPDALHLLGVIAHQCGRHVPALELIDAALQRRPHDPEFLNNLGQVLLALNRAPEAVQASQFALQLAPSFAEAHNTLGNAWKLLRQLEKAQQAYEAALRARPTYPEALSNLGLVLAEKGALNAAIDAHRRALLLNPRLAEAHCNLGNALVRHGDLESGLAAFSAARTCRPAFPMAMLGQAQVLHELRQFDAAMRVLQELVALQPAFAEAHSDLGRVFKVQARMTEAIASFRRAVALKPNDAELHSNLLFALHYHPAYSPEDLASEHRIWARHHEAPRRTPRQHHVKNFDPARRLRIGYVSPDFFQHPVARFLPALLDLDRQQFQVYGYANVRRPDEMTHALQAQCDVWRDIAALDDVATAELIVRDQIDVLVDLALHSGRNRLLVFARKPAPVQVTYLAYCSTSGMDSIDYRISDPYLDGAEIPTDNYCERTIRLPHSYWCYSVPEQFSPRDTPPNKPGDPITFGCLNNFCKISEPTLDCWSRILCAIPHSRLLLYALPGSHRTRVVEYFGCRGVTPERIAWVDRQPFAEYMQTHARIDIGLDPFPFTGGTTTCDALWMGTPVITLKGETAVGRGGVSILSNVGLPELIAETAEDYVERALRLAFDSSRRLELRRTLRERMTSSMLMNSKASAQHLGAAYRKMWGEVCLASGQSRQVQQGDH